jgi:hypothetical protein
VFTDRRLDYGELEEVLAGIVVRMRGWPLPYIDHRADVLRGEDWVGQDIDASVVSHYEAWRFFTSGQFSHLRAVSADWRTGAEATPTPNGASSVIEIWEILYYLTELYEFAARLALTKAGAEAMTLDVRLNGMHGRELVVGDPRRIPFSSPHRTNVPSYEERVTLQRDELVAEPRLKAVVMAREFFLRFGWNPSAEQLLEHQAGLTI